jgi:hypothetical protein
MSLMTFAERRTKMPSFSSHQRGQTPPPVDQFLPVSLSIVFSVFSAYDVRHSRATGISDKFPQA